MGLEELEARIRRVEDIEAIRKLKATYCDLVDAGLEDPANLEALLAHFTADAKLDFGMGAASQHEGLAGARTFFGQLVAPSIRFCMHMIHNSFIEVEGDSARGRWYFEVPAVDAGSGKAQWMAGRYLEQYRRERGEWKFAAMTVQWCFIAPYDQGWAAEARPLPRPADAR
jgi:ketosteroid isomerase-like protein